jgi:hypothetical protein
MALTPLLDHGPQLRDSSHATEAAAHAALALGSELCKVTGSVAVPLPATTIVLLLGYFV